MSRLSNLVRRVNRNDFGQYKWDIYQPGHVGTLKTFGLRLEVSPSSPFRNDCFTVLQMFGFPQGLSTEGETHLDCGGVPCGGRRSRTTLTQVTTHAWRVSQRRTLVSGNLSFRVGLLGCPDRTLFQGWDGGDQGDRDPSGPRKKRVISGHWAPPRAGSGTGGETWNRSEKCRGDRKRSDVPEERLDRPDDDFLSKSLKKTT